MNTTSEQAGLIAMAAFAGAFASIWVNQAFEYTFPVDLISLIVGILVLYLITYEFLRMGKNGRRK